MAAEVNFTFNGSLLEDDVLSDAADDTAYLSDNDLRRKIFSYIYIVIELAKIILCALALTSDIYLIVVISKFKNLQNRINNFILQYAIYNMLYLVLANLLFIIVELSGTYRHINYCFISNLDHLFITLCYYVVTFMALDWYIMNCHPNIYERYPKTFKYGPYILFGLAVPKWIATSTICFINEWFNAHKIRLHFEAVSFFLCLVIITCTSILKKRKNISSEAQKTEYAFSLPRTILVLSAFPLALTIFLYLIEQAAPLHNIFGLRWLYVLKEIMENLFFATPIIIVCQLTKSNKYFKSAYIKSCRKKTVKNYDDDDNLDADSVNQIPPNVAFDRSSEVIYF